MIENRKTDSPSKHEVSVEQYYKFHSAIYDATRWSFLFGRNQLLDAIPPLPAQPRILEIGCGTGKNLDSLQYYFPDAELVGIDVSESMLDVAKKKLSNSDHLTLINAKYGSQDLQLEPFDLVICSYSLTMVGDNIEDIMTQLYHDLTTRGYIAVVDFDTSPYTWFKHWMGVNHVDLSGHLLPLLNKFFQPVSTDKKSAYLGLWSYFTFIGQQS